jgi:SPP1 gp7 family putative phage head morphogenesis protein
MYYQIEHLPDSVLIELYYSLQKDKDRQSILELPLWFETISSEDSIFKAQSIDTDKEELDIKVLLSDILRESEKDTIAALYKADKGKLQKFHNQLKDIIIDKRDKEINNGTYIYIKSTLPVLVKDITLPEVDLIVQFNTIKTNKGLLESILASGQMGVNRAYKDAGLKNPYNLSTSKFADAYRDRARDFSGAVSDNVQSRIRTEIVNGIKEGEGVNDIAQRIREAYKRPIQVEVAATAKREGYIRTLDNKKWSQMVAQTETSWAANQGRLDAYKQSDLVKNVKWITRFNPCPDCASLRGRILTLEEATNMIPLHPNCHCSYVVNEYKEREEKPDTGFEGTTEQIYANPNGVGIMEMMKLDKKQTDDFYRLLDQNKIKEAEKFLRRFHIGGL